MKKILITLQLLFLFIVTTVSAGTIPQGETRFLGNILLGSTNISSQKELRFYEGTNYVGLKAGALTADQTWTLPITDGTSNQAMITDGNGNLRFGTVDGSGEINTTSNVGTVGTGIFKQKTGVDSELYKLNSVNNILSIALNGTDRIDFIITAGNINHNELLNYEVNRHLDWTTDQGATNIHAGNYIDTNTNAETICDDDTYLNGDGTCDTISVTDTNAGTICSGATTYLNGEAGCVDISGVYVNISGTPNANEFLRYINGTTAEPLTASEVRTALNVVEGAHTVDTTCDGASCNVSNTGTLDGYEASALLDNTDAQALDLTGDTLSISGNVGTIDLSKYLDNTDTQDLSYDTGTDVISLTDGGSVDISEVNTTCDGITCTVTNTGTLDGLEGAVLFTESTTGDVTISTGVSTIGADAVHDTMVDWGFGAGQINAGSVPVPTLGTPTYDSVGDVFKLLHSAGKLTGAEVTDAGSETVNVSAGTGIIRIADDDTSTLKSFDIPATNGIAIATDTVKYIVVDYNTGTEAITVTAWDNEAWDKDTEFPLAKIVNENGTLHILNNPWWIGDILTNVIERFQAFGYLSRDEEAGGLVLSVSDPTNAEIAVTAGKIWSRTNEFDITAVDTDVSGTFELYKYNGVAGTWSDTDVTAYPVTSYNDMTSADVVTLTNNYYMNMWVYVEADDDDVSMVYGQAEYLKSAQAEAEAPPTNIPVHLQESGLLIGRIIIQEGINIPVQVDTVWDTTFSASQAADHGNLSGLSDDDHPQYGALADAETITGNWVNTDNPWADNEVSDTLTSSVVTDGDRGDITITAGAWAVENDSHDHTGTSISGLGTVDFSSSNISQWTNDSGYITATLTQAQVEDYAGGLFTGNTETLITATYQVADNTLDLVVDNNLANYSNASSGFLTTEVDGSTTNEINTITTPDAEVTAGLGITFAQSGSIAITESADTITFTVTETDSAHDTCAEITGCVENALTTVDISANTNLAVSGYLLDLTGDTLSVNEGTFTNGKYCTYETAIGLVCNNEGGAGYTNLTSFVDQTAWRLFYSNADGYITEIALGADETYLMSNGASFAPTFEAVAGGGGWVGTATSNLNMATYDITAVGALTTTGSITIDSDNVGIVIGADQDASIYYDGIQVYIDTNGGGMATDSSFSVEGSGTTYFGGSCIILTSPDASCSECCIDNSDVLACSSITCP